MYNTNLKTGIAFGYLSASDLDADLLDDLLYSSTKTINWSELQVAEDIVKGVADKFDISIERAPQMRPYDSSEGSIQLYTEWEAWLERVSEVIAESSDEAASELHSELEDSGGLVEEPLIEGLWTMDSDSNSNSDDPDTYVWFGSSWLGGALNFFILESSYQVFSAFCSPCVPGAGNLKVTDGPTPAPASVRCYGVPRDWWAD